MTQHCTMQNFPWMCPGRDNRHKPHYILYNQKFVPLFRPLRKTRIQLCSTMLGEMSSNRSCAMTHIPYTLFGQVILVASCRQYRETTTPCNPLIVWITVLDVALGQ